MAEKSDPNPRLAPGSLSPEAVGVGISEGVAERGEGEVTDVRREEEEGVEVGRSDEEGGMEEVGVGMKDGEDTPPGTDEREEAEKEGGNA